MTRIVDAILTLRGMGAYAVVALLAFAEAGALIGLLVPGELAVVLGGVLASRGQVSLPVMTGVASVAAVLGESAGYELGRHLGPGCCGPSGSSVGSAAVSCAPRPTSRIAVVPLCSRDGGPRCCGRSCRASRA